jgi:sporulation integral membrane protein YtvI
LTGIPNWQRVLAALVWIVGLVLVFVALKYVVPYFLPFLVALMLAVLIDPTVDGIEERLRVPRGVAVGLALVFFFGLFLGLVLFGIGALVMQLGELAANLPAHYEKLVLFTEDLLDRLTEAYSGMPEDMVAFIDTSVRGSLQSVYLALSSLVTALLNALRGLPMAFILSLVSLVAAFFISRDKALIAEFCLSLLPPNWRDRARAVNRDVLSSVVGLVKAQLLLVALTTVLTVIGLLLMGVRYAWLVGLLTGILDILPIVGPTVVLVPWAVYCFIDGNTWLGVGLMALHLGLSTFRQFMEPRIIGQRLGLHPLIALLSLYLGIRLLGVTGLVVGPLVAIIIKALFRPGPTPPAAGPPAPRTKTTVASREAAE